MMAFKIIIYLLFILFIYRLISNFFSIPRSASKKRGTTKGKEIEYKDADFEELD